MDCDLLIVSGILISGAGMAVIPLFKDVLKDRTQNISVANISWSGWLMLLLLTSGILLGVIKEKRDRDETDLKEASISSRSDSRHTQDSIQWEGTVIRDSIELGKARDSINSFMGKIKRGLDSANIKKQRHVNDKYVNYILKELNEFPSFNPNFNNHSRMAIGIDINDLESKTFSNEIIAELIKHGYDNIRIDPFLSFGEQTKEVLVSNDSGLPLITILPLKAITH